MAVNWRRIARTAVDSSSALPSLLQAYWCFTILLCIASVAGPEVYAHLGYQDFPWAPVLLPSGHYTSLDLLCFSDRFAFFHQLRFFTGPHTQEFNYPAPIAIFLELFFLLTPDPAMLYFGFGVFCFTVAGVLFARALSRRGVLPLGALLFTVSLLVCAYPVQLLLLLGNTELAVWICTALGVWAHVTRRSWLAAVCFGLATSMKYFPLVYFGLLLARRQYRQTLAGIATAVLSTLLSLAILGPTIRIAYVGLSDGVQVFADRYINRFNDLESGIDHSIFNVVRYVMHAYHFDGNIPDGSLPYLASAAALGLACYVWRIRKLPTFNQVLALAVASVLLPPVSHDYTLIHLLAPLAMLLLQIVEQPPARGTPAWTWTAVTLSLFALLFAGENYLIVDELRLGGELKAIVLVSLFFVALTVRFTPCDSLADRAEAPAPESVGVPSSTPSQA